MHYTASIILKDELNAEDMVHDTFLKNRSSLVIC